MENKGKQKYNPRDDMSLDQAILQWIVDDYDIPDEKSRKIVGESGKKSKLITCKMVINALENQLEWYKIEGSRHPDWEIVEVYVDQGITGTQAQKRPEFLRIHVRCE